MAKEHTSLVITWKNETEAAKKCESLQELKEKQVNDMYDKKWIVWFASTLASYDFFSQGPYEISKDMFESSPIASPAALEVAISFTAEKSKLLPRYRWVG